MDAQDDRNGAMFRGESWGVMAGNGNQGPPSIGDFTTQLYKGVS